MSTAPPEVSGKSASRLGIALDKAPETEFVPSPPTTFAEAGLDPTTVETLILKRLLNVGSRTGGQCAREMGLPNNAVLDLFEDLRRRQIVSYTGSGAAAGDYLHVLTEQGRELARRYLLENMYADVAPVPVDMYIASVKAQTIAGEHPLRKDLEDAFSDLLIDEDMFARLGPAINSGRGMFLYGYPGNGKTSIAERITQCFGSDIYIPYAVECEGLIIKMFDAANHEVVEQPKGSLLKTESHDPRWVKIKRPTIVVGGELTMDDLEIQYNEVTKVCEAPMQMKSNCGTLVIDDFGRQRMRPIELLNRWIVPLEKRYDFLALPNGKKLQIPFDQLIIFSTNLEPKDLVDDAFLRRIPYKICAEDPTEENFRKLFEIFAPKLGFEFNQAVIDHLVEEHYRKTGRPFRCCQPRDLLLQVLNHCLYNDQPLELTPESIDFACSNYFTVM